MSDKGEGTVEIKAGQRITVTHSDGKEYEFEIKSINGEEVEIVSPRTGGLWFVQMHDLIKRLDEEAAAVTLAPRGLTIVGWDGASNPKYRYTDEMILPDYARHGVSAADIAASKAVSR